MPCSPPQPRRSAIVYGEVQLVAAAPLWRPRLLVAEDREVIGVRCLRPHDRVVQHVIFGRHLVPRHDRQFRVAEEPGMHPREVTEVGEVLHLAGGIAPPRGKARPSARPSCRPQARAPPAAASGDPPARPRSSRSALGPGTPRTRALAGTREGSSSCGIATHRPSAPVGPAVVGTHELVPADGAERQCGAAVHAEVRHGPHGPVAAAPQDQRLTQQVSVHRIARPARRRNRRDASMRAARAGQRKRRARSRVSLPLGLMEPACLDSPDP